jgi:hypothetical protein
VPPTCPFTTAALLISLSWTAFVLMAVILIKAQVGAQRDALLLSDNW